MHHDYKRKIITNFVDDEEAVEESVVGEKEDVDGMSEAEKYINRNDKAIYTEK